MDDENTDNDINWEEVAKIQEEMRINKNIIMLPPIRVEYNMSNKEFLLLRMNARKISGFGLWLYCYYRSFMVEGNTTETIQNMSVKSGISNQRSSDYFMELVEREIVSFDDIAGKFYFRPYFKIINEKNILTDKKGTLVFEGEILNLAKEIYSRKLKTRMDDRNNYADYKENIIKKGGADGQ